MNSVQYYTGVLYLLDNVPGYFLSPNVYDTILLFRVVSGSEENFHSKLFNPGTVLKSQRIIYNKHIGRSHSSFFFFSYYLLYGYIVSFTSRILRIIILSNARVCELVCRRIMLNSSRSYYKHEKKKKTLYWANVNTTIKKKKDTYHGWVTLEGVE